MTLLPLALGLLAVAPPVLPDHKGPLVLSRDGQTVVDRAGLFSPATVREARRRIDEVESSDGIGLVIETVKELPELPAAELRKMRSRAARTRLREIAQDRADAARCNGLFVLIVQEPPNVTVVGWPGQRELDVSSVKRENLRKYLAGELGSNPNRALLGACDTFAEIAQSIQAKPPTPFAPLTALVLLASLFGGWLILLFVRSRVVRPAAPIYQPAMLGSLFGVPPAYWIYDRLFHAERPLAPTNPEPEPTPAQPLDAAPADTGEPL